MAKSQFAPSVISTSHKQRMSTIKQTFGRLRRYCSEKLRPQPQPQPQLQPHPTTQPASPTPFLALPAEIPNLPCQTCSRLLDLPPELRNAIYEYALVIHQPITISKTSQWTQPGLLRACKQIRQEAAPIYYGMNQFHIYCPSLDFTLSLAFRTHSGKWRKGLNNVEVVDIGNGRPNWSTFLVFLEAVHEAGASQMVVKLRGSKWTDVEAALEIYKKTVVDVGPGWTWG
ncbi:hypothetical protein LTR97_003370 [Elasticomyces elasticus]|uniref:Uncharacterized protein n=1 Tax=Elasticomyces elasticus TaxID=574655 RepID=A0AAN8A4X8_9PEZI|nr:hypothetical protein LTR97_003370 [Elasticomyces elasticus]